MDARRIKRTILSGGLFINLVLANSDELRAVMGDNPRIFPVASMEEEDFPCVSYTREGLETTGTKGTEPARGGTWSVTCWSRDYVESLNMAEAVAEALDGTRVQLDNGLTMRYCALVDATETAYENGVYAQEMIFMIRIN